MLIGSNAEQQVRYVTCDNARNRRSQKPEHRPTDQKVVSSNLAERAV